MFRVFAPGLLGFLMFALWLYAVFDVIATDSAFIRNLPKITWLFIVIIVPVVGAIAWLALGRPINAGLWPGDTSTRPVRRVVAPEDRDDWGSRHSPSADAAKERRLAEWEAELRRREAALEGHEPDERDDDPAS